MNRFDWLSEYLAQLHDELIVVRHGSMRDLAPAYLLQIDDADWGRAGELAAAQGYRWAGVWGDHIGDEIQLHACLENTGDYLILQTHVAVDSPMISSHTPYYPAADRPERHIQDLLGIVFLDHFDHRPWIRHKAWEEGRYPLRHDFPLLGEPADMTPPDGSYPFHLILGAGVYEIPVGPVHAGIIEPGHFRFNSVGEQVLSLEQHMGYTHKGIEKLAVGKNPHDLVRLAARVSGDSTVAHAWAACQALERASGCSVPARGLAIRALLCERERVANHLGDIGAICNDVGFAFAHYQCSRLREQWQRRSAELFGHRFMMDVVVPGGVECDLNTQAVSLLQADHAALLKESMNLFDILNDQPTLADRLQTTGTLSTEIARSLGCLGYLGKASGLDFDVRRANPYSPYDRIPVATQCEQKGEGDVAARVQVRMCEIGESVAWMDAQLKDLPEGEVKSVFPRIAKASQGIGFVEGWRGEIICYVRIDDKGRVARFFPRDPSWHSWPAMPYIMQDTIVPDFPVCNKSMNGSYSGQDL